MKKTIYTLALLTSTLLTFKSPSAGTDPVDYRRTLFVPVAGRTLFFEAPTGMCFIDPSKEDSADMAYNDTARLIGSTRTEVLLAVFAPCFDIAPATGGEKPFSSVGYITWLNPAVGPTVHSNVRDYISGQAATFKNHIKKTLAYLGHQTRASKRAMMLLPPTESYQIDKTPRVTGASVSVGYTASFEYEFEKYNIGGVSATTALHQVPIAVSFRETDSLPINMAPLYKLADEFLEQQIALNP